MMADSTNFSIEELRFDNYGLTRNSTRLARRINSHVSLDEQRIFKKRLKQNVHYWSRSRSEIWRKGAQVKHSNS